MILVLQGQHAYSRVRRFMQITYCERHIFLSLVFDALLAPMMCCRHASSSEDHEYDVNSCFSTLCSGSVSKREWALLKGKMEVRPAPIKATVYLEGPPVGVDILASCFSIAPSNPEPVRSSVPLQYCPCFPKLLI